MRMPAIALAITVIFVLQSCDKAALTERAVTHGRISDTQAESDSNSDAPWQPTRIPFDINHITDAQSAVIRAGNELDSSSYLIQTRPVVFQIVMTGNNAKEVRHTGPIDRPVDVLIYSLGEAQGERLVDYGWIECVESGERVWEMTLENSKYAGGDRRNRKSVKQMTLQPGRYRLHYVSSSNHAFPDWQGDPPERPNFYGVTVFNLTALPAIERRLKAAGLPGLQSTLNSAGE